ncbi:adenylate cyclase [Pseudochelatococcus lubricantis]|uniref:Adenylate cyclase n=1 Tax=Pseudochelatococcus lubricantis TaxID=1538102 RepID=A0ABX0UZC7_9HYPH|nr:adenylate/guanylate cyclase domain-containing protein [Pseudochelatococcus lubricantis]NIJ58309.1 adenylate cyclase [Pseudochelatococcus lubricantis]
MTMSSSPVLPSHLTLRKLRIATGLVMFVFMTTHLLNHSLNLISLPVAESGLRWFAAFWGSAAGGVLLYGAVLTHIGLVLHALYRRCSLRMQPEEAFQLVLGLLIPLFLIDHVVATRVAHALHGERITYESVIRSLWVTTPVSGVRQTVALVVAWAHGCIGLHFWLRYRDWYRDASPSLLMGATLLPVLALLGFSETGRLLARAPAPVSPLPEPEVLASADAGLQLARLTLYGAFGGLLAGTFGLRGLRQWRERGATIVVHYPGNRNVRVPRGFTVLEASRVGRIPHYAVCGGKGRCSTCRVEVLGDPAALPPPDELEKATLERVGAPPGVRLACQLRPAHDISVAPVLVPHRKRSRLLDVREMSPGREQEIAVMFCDMRNFTGMTEKRLPYDTVFLLNRYFALVGQAVEESGGRIDKFIGDGAMALFGIDSTPRDGCRAALRAARKIAEDIERLHRELGLEFPAPLRVAIGIHAGPAVIGVMGYGRARSLTAVGDTVNVASRLESVAKERNATLVVSEPVMRMAQVDTDGLPADVIQVRGRAKQLRVFVDPPVSPP